MKRWILSLALCLCLCLTICGLCGRAKAADVVASGNCGQSGANVTWSLDSEGTMTISGSGKMKDYIYSSAMPWDSNKNSIKNIVVGNGVTSIGNYTFYGCAGLTSISLPDGVTSIRSGAFEGCTGLTSISLPDGVTSIGYSAFRGCTGLTSISLPDGVTSIRSGAFEGCTGLTSISLPDGVTSIGGRAFSGCTNIGTIFFNGNAPTISKDAFKGIKAVAFYILEDTTWDSQKLDYGGTLYWASYNPAKEIVASGLCGENILWQIDKNGVLTVKGNGILTDVSWWSLYRAMITEVVFSDAITMMQIPDSGFDQYVHLRSIILPSGIKSIGSSAFSGCESLTSISIPESVTSIGGRAFSGCGSLTSISIPESVTSIGTHAFYNCESISSVYITDIDCWLRINFSLDNNPLASGAALYLNDALLTDLAIPEGYTSVPAYVFYGCSSLKRVVLPSTVTSLGECAFYGCTALERFAVAEDNPAYCSDADGVLMNREKTTLYVCPAQLSGGYVIPETIKRIEDDAFRNCSRLKSIAFRGAKPSIGGQAFYGVRADSYYPESLGSDVSWTQGGAFAGYGGKLNWRPWYTLGNDLLCEHVLVDTVVPPSCTFGYTLHQCPCGYSYRTDFEPGAGHDLVADPAVPATCTETGLTKGSHCARCDYKVEQKVVPALGHDYIDHEAKAASCTAVGWAAYQTCSRCDYTTYKEIPAKGHTAAAAVKEKEVAATCTKDGSYDEVVYCSACKEEMSRTSKTVHALGHDLVTDAAVAATCTETGLTKGSHCTRCDYKVEQEVVPALGHDYIDHEAKAASCTAGGWEAYQTCSRCDYTTYKEIPAKGHTAAAAVRENEVTATCTKDGSYDEVVYCSACEEEMSRTSKTVHALGHALVTDAAVAATCTETGLTKGSHCTRCDYKVEQEVVPALGHDYIDHEAKAASCTAIGWEAYQTCSRCDYTTYKEIPAKGHTAAAAVRENEVTATCTKDGSYDEVVYCSTCEEELSRTSKTVHALGHALVTDAAVAATCTETGLTEGGHCARCDYKVEQEVIPALGHAWDTPTYVWSEDYGAITATRICKRDANHTEQERGTVTSMVTKEATYDAAGEITYTATFENAAFTTQTKTVETPKLERPTPTENPFTDVRESEYYYNAVLWAVTNGVTSGTSATTFSPADGCTRAQVVSFLWRAAGKPAPTGRNNPFADVKENEYYYNAVLWAVEQGITAGTSLTAFSPNATCTRAQIVTFLWRFAGQPEPSTASNPFQDVSAQAYYAKAVLWAAENAVTSGTSNTTFSPDATCTRAQVVTFLYRDIVK